MTILEFLSRYQHSNNSDYFNRFGYINHSKIVDFEQSGPSVLIGPEKKKTDAMKFGSLVDCLLLTPEEFDTKYKVVTENTKLTDTMQKIYNKLVAYCDYEGIDLTYLYSQKNKVISLCREIQVYPNYSDDVLFKKIEENARTFNILYSTRFDTEIISSEEFNKATLIVEAIKKSNVTKKIFSSKYKVFTQVAIYDTTHKTKALFDMIVVDVSNKKLYPIDLKTTSVPETEFLSNSFYKFEYYRQAELYMDALKTIVNVTSDDWTIEDFQFLVVNSETPKPLLYKFPILHDDDGKLIINKYGKSVRPYTEIIEEILWHFNKGIYDYPKDFAIELTTNANNYNLISINILDV